MRDFRYYDADKKKKESTDIKVEQELLAYVDSECNNAKRKKNSFVSQARRYADGSSGSQTYMNKAEQVDMVYCGKAEEFRTKI